MSVDGTSPSAIRSCDGRKRSIDTYGEQRESDNLKSEYVAETKRALRQADTQSVALFPINTGGTLAPAVAN